MYVNSRFWVVGKRLIAYSWLYLAQYLELWLCQGRLLASISAHLTWSVLAWSLQCEQSVGTVSLRLRSWNITLCDRQLMKSALPASRASAGKFVRANQSLFIISSELAVLRRTIRARKAKHCNCLLKMYYCELPLSLKL